jgi:hypothetical protein
MPKPKSQKQARLFGMIASGKKKVSGFSKTTAKDSLRGQKVSKLPTRSKKKKP